MKSTDRRIDKLSRSESITKLSARAHVTASDAEALRIAFEMVSGFDNAPARELFIFASAVIRAHRRNALRFRIAIAS